MHEPFDRAAMIEAASRSLRQQMARGAARDRPRSKGSLHNDGAVHAVQSLGGPQRPPPLGATGQSSSSSGLCAASASEAQSAESAQRRIRSAENQHRMLRSDGMPHFPNATPAAAAAAQATAAAHVAQVAAATNGDHPGALETDSPNGFGGGVPVASSALDSYSNPEEADLDQDVLQNYRQELKRPLSRKKDPSASAAAGLGAFDGPARMTDAFGEAQRKTRQPIPVESWGPRPPSRAGPQGSRQAASFDEGFHVEPGMLLAQSRSRSDGASSSSSRPAEKGGRADQVVGGTWAAARAEPRGHSETRRGRDRRTVTRGSPEVGYAAADLGIFGVSSQVPSQRLSKSLSGVFDHHSAQLAPRGVPWQHVTAQLGSWAANADVGVGGALEVSGCGLGGDQAGSPWPASPSETCGSPPTRAGKTRIVDGVHLEDMEADSDLIPHSGFRRDVAPQVIVTRSQGGKSRGNIRRSSDHRAARFNTSLDVDFLSLFAS